MEQETFGSTDMETMEKVGDITFQELMVDAVLGTVPYYNIQHDARIEPYGHYTGGFHDKWTWYDSKLKKLDIKQLKEIYLLCKNSWK